MTAVDWRQQLAAAMRWGRANGWRPTYNGFVSADERIRLSLNHGVDGLGPGFGLSIADDRGRHHQWPPQWPVDTTVQAIDVLVALGVLPTHLSSTAVEVERLRSVLAAVEQLADPAPDFVRVGLHHAAARLRDIHALIERVGGKS